MFYNPRFLQSNELRRKNEVALVVLTPSESKRLIAKGVASMPEIQAVLKKGMLVIGWGGTNAFIVEEVLKREIEHKADYASGVITGGELNANHIDTKIMPFVYRNGKPSDIHARAALENFQPGDVFIKGANAIDPSGTVGIMAGGHTGGTAHASWFAAGARGGLFICPVGLEKLVSSVYDASEKCGLFRFKYSMGPPVSLLVFPMAQAVTEIQAIKLLSGVDAYHVASGGSGGSEGAVSLVLEGESNKLEKAFAIIKSIKGEPHVAAPRKLAAPSAASLEYDPQALAKYIQRR